MAYVGLGVLGAIVGSFLNVVIHRLPLKESIVSPGSRCPSCGTPLKPYDNVPIVSWLVLRGRCRSCGEPISPRYPLVELATALSFAGVALARGLDDDLVVQLPFVAVLVGVAGIDLDHKVIPNVIVVPAGVYGLAASALVRPGELPELAIAGAGAFAFLLVAALVYPAGMGMGDVKLAGLMGLYLGSAVIPALFAGFLGASLVGVAMMARQGAGARKRGVPFGPFLALGGLVGLLAGPELVDLYRDEFL